MEGTKHKPGPWAVNPIMRDQICSADGARWLATVNRYGDPHEVIATSQLIAAAPELLAALKKLLAMFDSEIKSDYEGTSLYEERLAEADFARIAVAKALGEQN